MGEEDLPSGVWVRRDVTGEVWVWAGSSWEGCDGWGVGGEGRR